MNEYDNNKEILEYLDTMINNDSYINEAISYIKENFNVNGRYDQVNNKLYIWTNNVNESLNINSAVEHIRERFSPEMLTIEFGHYYKL